MLETSPSISSVNPPDLAVPREETPNKTSSSIIPLIKIEGPTETPVPLLSAIAVGSSVESIKTTQVARAALNLVPISKGLTSTIKYLVGLHHSIQGLGLVDKALLAKKVITDLTGKMDLGDKFKSYKIIQNKICALIDKYGAEAIEKQLLALAEGHLYDDKNVTELDLLRSLERLDLNAVPEIEWSDNIVELTRHLQPGDIVFFQNIGSYTSLADLFVSNGQWFAKLWTEGSLDYLSETFTHVGIYLGNGQMAEAQRNQLGEDVRIISWDDPYMRLQPGSGWQYVIYRPKNNEIAIHAANLARRFAEDKSLIKAAIEKGQVELLPELKTKFSYSQFAAVHAIFKSSLFSLEAKKRALAQLIQLYNNIETPLLKNWASQGFYCSFLVAECLQQGNILHLFNSLQDQVGRLPRLKGEKPIEEEKIMTAWIDNALKEYPTLLDDLVMQFNPQYISPQKLWQFVQRSDLFDKKLRIIPPKLENVS